MSAQAEPVIVIGSGMGGLATAIALAARGQPVVVHEAGSSPGGKLRALEIAGQPLDAGPTVLTMRSLFDELLGAAGHRLEPLPQQASVLARHYWSDGSTLDLHADPARSVAAIGDFAGAAEARRFQAFMRQARAGARLLEPAFLRQPRPSPMGIALAAARRQPTALLQLNPFATLWRTVERGFRDPRLQQLFARYATYCGSDPWLAPATLGMIAQVEADGVWLLPGGLHQLARALERAAVALGVRFHYGSRVTELELDRNGIAAVRLHSGERVATGSVVFNGDAAALADGLLGGDPRLRGVAPRAAPRSLSAITWNLLATTGGVPLSHHNVFFSDDYRREFRALSTLGRVPDAPTVYVCAQDRLEGGPAMAAGAERLLCLVNAPALRAGSREDDAFAQGGLQACEATMRRQLAQCGLELADQAPGIATTPADFARLFPGSRGALYGTATHGWRAAFQRPTARSRIPGLYLAGGSIHPGPGLPMAALSGMHAADCVLTDRSSRRRWRTTATRGGTSMPWATMPPAD